MKRLVIIIITFMFLAPHLFSATAVKDYSNFYKGVVYFLLKDKVLAEQKMESFFRQFPDPSLKGAFINLIKENSFDVTDEFKRYLDNNHRSKTALVGISLSVSDLKAFGAIENLQRGLRLDEEQRAEQRKESGRPEEPFSIIYLCMGVEYMKQLNYPKAESYFNLALQDTKIPEYKILLAKMFLQKNELAKVISLLKPEAEKQPDNYYYNYYTARALYRLGQLDEMSKFITGALEIGPDKIDAQLLMAKYLTGKNRFKEAQNILKDLKFKDYNEEYNKTYARVLFELKDRKAKNYMDLVYSKNKWDKEMNRLMAQYYEWKKTEKGNIQNWITRALLSGNSIQELQKYFPGGYKYPEYKFLPFFQVKALKWVSNDIVAVGAIRSSGESGKLFFIQANDLKIINALDYVGELKFIFRSSDGSKLLFSTDNEKDGKSYLYAVEIYGQSMRLKLLTPGGSNLSTPSVGFNSAGTLAYITDHRLAELAFESPFSITRESGEKITLFDSFKFPLFVYNFSAGQFGSIKDVEGWLSKVPIPSVKKYYRVSDARGSKSEIQNLIEKGQKLDITSSEIVKIFFSDDLSSFIIYLSDLKNAFQACIYESRNNSVKKIDEFMFLGQYAELKLLDFDPAKKEIMALTKDANKRLIRFNYNNYSYLQPTDKVLHFYLDKRQNRILALTERSKKQAFTETNLEIISFKPYIKKIVDTRRDLNKILFIKNETDVYFSTFTGELVKMDENYNFYYMGPSFDGCRYEMSPSKTKTAGFINGRLVVVDGPIIEAPGKRWASKENFKK